MKKLLVLLALCMVLSIVMVACDTPVEPGTETTAGETTEAPTNAETEAPSETQTETDAPGTTETETETQTQAPDTTTETETETQKPADPVKVGMSFDECDAWINGENVGAFFTPGQSTSWDLKANVEDYNVQAIRVWGWVAFFAETPGTFGYQIGDADPVFDAAFSIEAEQPVIDAALAQGGKSAARMKIFIPVEYLSGEEIVIKALAKDVNGTVETLVEFKLTKPVNPNAPVVFIPAADMASSIPGSPGVNGATMSADGTYITVDTIGQADPYYQLPMLNQKGTVAQFAAFKYRTDSTSYTTSEMFVGSGAGPNGQGDNIRFELTCDGNWQLAIVDLSKASALVDNTINYLRWDFFAGNANATIDAGYVALFSSAEAAIAYDAQFASIYRNVPYHVDQNVILGVRDGGTPFTAASDKKFGQRFDTGADFLKKVTINDLATYSDGNANTWSFKVWAWNTDYATTTAATPLFEVLGENHPDNQTFAMDIPAKLLISGDIYYEIEYLSGSGGFTGWVAKDVPEGVETYKAGNKVDGSFASYITVGVEAELNENGDATKSFATDVNANEIGTGLGDTDLKNFFITELPLAGSGIEAFGDGKIYHMTSINDMFADMNGYYYITATDVAANAGGCNFIFIRGYSAVNSDEIISVADPAQNLYKINNYYETDTAGGQSGLCGGAGIYTYIAEGNLYIIVKYYDAEAVTRVGNAVFTVPVEGTTLTIADKGDLVSFIVNGKTYATIALEGAIDYADIKEVKPAGQFAAKATVTTIDGSVNVIENTLVAATVESQIGVVSRGGSIKFTSLTIDGYSKIEVPELTVDAPAAPEFVAKDDCADFDRFSFDGFYLNDNLYFEQDGMANTKLEAIGNTVTISGAQTIGYRGWISFKSAPAAGFGYYIVGVTDGAVQGEFLQERPDLAGAGIVNGTGYKIDVPVADLAAGTYTTGMVAFLADGTIVKLYEITLIVEAPVVIENYNVPVETWTISGHRPALQDSTDGMVAAGGVQYGALLHQGYIGVGEVNLANYSKAIVYFGIDGSQVTIDVYNANANNRIIITSADQAMTMSPTADVVLAATTYSELGWAVHAVEIDLTGVDYNGPVYVTYDTLPGTFMLISSIEFIA